MNIDPAIAAPSRINRTVLKLVAKTSAGNVNSEITVAPNRVFVLPSLSAKIPLGMVSMTLRTDS
jgi:hypothetical protein